MILEATGGQLACSNCGCLLAQIDTEVLKKCPGCEQSFKTHARPVPQSDAPAYQELPQKETPLSLATRATFLWLALLRATDISEGIMGDVAHSPWMWPLPVCVVLGFSSMAVRHPDDSIWRTCINAVALSGAAVLLNLLLRYLGADRWIGFLIAMLIGWMILSLAARRERRQQQEPNISG